jgi:hypothetical protein
MTKAECNKLVKLLKKLREEVKQEAGIRSTIVDCTSFLIAALGVKEDK